MTALADLPVAQTGQDTYHEADSLGAGPAAVRDVVLVSDQSGAIRDRAKPMRSWPLLVLAVPAAAEVWSGWVGIAQKTGFGMVSLLPGLWSSLHLDTAVTLPVGVECYAAYALRAWLATGHAISDRTRRFAKRSAICSFALGMAGQVAFHLMDQNRITRAPWTVTTLVSCLPVLVLGMGTALAHMLREDATAAGLARTSPPGPAAQVPRAWSPAEHLGDRPDQHPPDRTTSEPHHPARVSTVPKQEEHAAPEPVAPVPHATEPGTESARRIARELAGAGQRISRRALRSRGVRGSNEALNALALTLTAELANDTAGLQ
jgi:hypothetical protein